MIVYESLARKLSPDAVSIGWCVTVWCHGKLEGDGVKVNSNRNCLEKQT